MEAYCQRIGVRSTEVRFMVDGERIDENDTPDRLGKYYELEEQLNFNFVKNDYTGKH